MKDKIVILNRRKRPTWMFQSQGRYGYYFKSKYGNDYKIFQDLETGRPFWIGRAFYKDVETRWVDVTKEIRSYRLEFPNGGEYYFPRKGF